MVEKKVGLKGSYDKLVTYLSGGFFVVFVTAAIINVNATGAVMSAIQNWTYKLFGGLWQLILFLNFILAIYFVLSRFGNVRLGGLDKPEFNNVSFAAMLFCTAIAAGAVFWAAAEPFSHLMAVPPAYQNLIQPNTIEAGGKGMIYGAFHWGIIVWALYLVFCIPILRGVYKHGLPFTPATALYPIIGEKGVRGTLGKIINAFSIIAVAAGTIGPIGFLTMQLSAAFEFLFGIPDVWATRLVVIAVIMIVYTISAISGIHKGIKILSNINIRLGVALLLSVLLLGKTGALFSGFITVLGGQFSDFVTMSLWREPISDSGWLNWWTVFYWGWWIGYAPITAMFLARVSRGRTIRQIAMGVLVVCPLALMLFYSFLGGSAVYAELADPGVISGTFGTLGYPGVLWATLGTLPFTNILAVGFIILISLFLITTCDSMSLTCAIAVSGNDNPHVLLRLFWGLTFGITAGVLMFMGGLQALQSAIIVTCIPITFIVILVMYTAYASLNEDEGYSLTASTDSVEEA